MTESGWVIEHKDSEVYSPAYFAANAPEHNEWPKDHLAATRFARECDAEAVAEMLFGKDHGHRICEHGWG